MIKGPKNAYPTNRGWVHEKTGELLKAQKITDAQIQEWIGVPPAPEPAPVVEEPVEEVVVEETPVLTRRRRRSTASE